MAQFRGLMDDSFHLPNVPHMACAGPSVLPTTFLSSPSASPIHHLSHKAMKEALKMSQIPDQPYQRSAIPPEVTPEVTLILTDMMLTKNVYKVGSGLEITSGHRQCQTFSSNDQTFEISILYEANIWSFSLYMLNDSTTENSLFPALWLWGFFTCIVKWRHIFFIFLSFKYLDRGVLVVQGLQQIFHNVREIGRHKACIKCIPQRYDYIQFLLFELPKDGRDEESRVRLELLTKT